MESRNGESHSSHGSVAEVGRIAWPLVVSMLSYTAMGVADTLFVGWIGTVELAAVGLATSAFFLINSFFVGTLHGAKVVVAQATGAGRHNAAVNTGWHAVFLALPFGLAVIALSSVDGVIFSAMGGAPEVQYWARVYFVARVWASPFWFAMMGAADYFQGKGDTRTPMKVNLVVNLLNVVLDALLVFGLGPIPALGVAGVAWATVIASIVGMVLMLRLFVRRHGGVHFAPRLSVYREILRLGLPMGVRYVLNVAGLTLFTAVVARMGTVALAAHQVAFKIISVSFLPGYGLGEAATVLTGQYVGAGKPEHAHRSYLSATKISVALMGAFGLVFWVFPEGLIMVFQSDPEVVRLGASLLLLAAVFQVFDAVAMTGIGALNGAGDTRFTMLVSLAAVWLLEVPLAYVFGVTMNLGVFGAWMGITIEIMALSAVVAYRSKSVLAGASRFPAQASRPPV